MQRDGGVDLFVMGSCEALLIALLEGAKLKAVRKP